MISFEIVQISLEETCGTPPNLLALRVTTYIHTIPTTITTKKDKFYTQVQVAKGKTVHRERGEGGGGHVVPSKAD